MRTKTLLLAVFSLCLGGCDLSEAERMDITRQKVRDVVPEVTGLSFLGRQEVSIDSLLGLAPGLAPEKVWKLDFGDQGTWSSIDWIVRGWWKDSLVFSAEGSTGTGSWTLAPFAGEWMRHPGELRTDLLLTRTYWISGQYSWSSIQKTDTIVPKGSFSLPFVQDVNELRWDTTFTKKSPRNGDTLRLQIRVDRGSPGRTDSMPVFADYNGLRTLGDYVRYLKADDTATLAWVVTGAAGDSIRLDLAWGKYGETHGFRFRVAR